MNDARTLNTVPGHIGVIMDGNGRWAENLGVSRLEGHRAGVRNLEEIMEGAQELGVKCMTVYAFSTENWGRPEAEVEGLMGLLEIFLDEYESKMMESGVKLGVIGRWQELPNGCVERLQRAIATTKENKTFELVLALNYSSRTEVTDAIGRYIQAGHKEEPKDWATFRKYLDSAEREDPDLIIRTGGEQRLSNFLLLQGAYAELYVSDVNWPDFGVQELKDAIESYKRRERRFGKTSEQIRESYA